MRVLSLGAGVQSSTLALMCAAPIFRRMPVCAADAGVLSKWRLTNLFCAQYAKALGLIQGVMPSERSARAARTERTSDTLGAASGRQHATRNRGTGKVKTIWQVELPKPICHVHLPVGAQVVRVGRQGASVCVWAIVESSNALEDRLFATAVTGQPLPHDVRYLGTWDDGPFVWHLFELTRTSETHGEQR